MLNSKMSVVILAAGKSTRMCSHIPKVLHTISGKYIIQYLIDVAINLNSDQIHLVHGNNGGLLKKKIQNSKINWIHQNEQLGTGHAIQKAAPFFRDDEDIMVLYGDVPLISVKTLTKLRNSKKQNGVSILTVILEDPTGYGRVIRKNGKINQIIEHEEANDTQRQIKEINTGFLIAGASDMKRWLEKLTNNNLQGEYYCSDIISIAYQEGYEIISVNAENLIEVAGVNNLLQLSKLERAHQTEQAEQLLLSGVMIRDLNRFDLRGTISHGIDVEIGVNVIFEGEIKIGHRVKIGPCCTIKNSIIGDDCIINSYSVIENSYLKSECIVGPFAHLRPKSKLAERAYVGNFVEIKKSCLGKDSKAGHLTYLGDAEIGDNVNIGAGTITCNYDGAKKSKTIICDDVFIGSDTQIIAPVIIGKGATIAAGTTLTKNVKDNELVLSRIPQVHKKKWKRPMKNKVKQ